MSSALIPAETPAPPHEPTPLNKADLLSALDAQIKFVSEAQRNEGWTRWAIYGALAAMLWHSTELVTHQDFALSRAVLVAFAVFILWSVLESLTRLILPASRVLSAAPIRFHLWTDLVSIIRPGVVASALRQVLILIALIVFHFPDQWPLWTYSILSLAGDLMIFVPGMSNLTFPSRLGMRAAFTLATLIPLAWLIFAGVHVARLIQNDLSAFTLADVRFALLMNAGAYLLIRLATQTSSNHVLDELTELRQQLAFDRITASAAMRQAESLLTGLRLADALNPSVEHVLKESRELTEMVNRATEVLNQLRTTEFTGDKHAIADRVRRLDELEVEERRLTARLKALVRTRSRFQIRALCIALYSRESLPELKPPAQKVQDAFAQGNKGVAEFRQQFAALKQQVHDLTKSFGTAAT